MAVLGLVVSEELRQVVTKDEEVARGDQVGEMVQDQLQEGEEVGEVGEADEADEAEELNVAKDKEEVRQPMLSKVYQGGNTISRSGNTFVPSNTGSTLLLS